MSFDQETSNERSHVFFDCPATRQNMSDETRKNLVAVFRDYPTVCEIWILTQRRVWGFAGPASALFLHCDDGPHVALALASNAHSQGRRNGGGKGKNGKEGFAALPLRALTAHPSAGPEWS